MYKQLYPKPISQIPSVNTFKPTNLVEASEKKNNIFNKQPTQPVLTPIPELQSSSLPQNDSFKIEEDSFRELIKTKLTKIDEFLITMKDKQDTLYDFVKNNPQSQIPPPAPIQLPPQTVTETSQKQSRTKKTYYKINETMWSEIKSSFTDLPDKYKDTTYSDGSNYYVDHKNKKLLLDGKTYLKLLNNK